MSNREQAESPKLPLLNYAFSIRGAVQAQKIGQTPAGTLIDVDYSSLIAETKRFPDSVRQMVWDGISGRAIAGSDWALVRPDGVIEFNGRFTLQTSGNVPDDKKVPDNKRVPDNKKETGEGHDKNDTDSEHVLINVVITGVVDLLKAYEGGGTDRNTLLADWDHDSERRDLPINLAVRFEVAQATEPWAAKRFKVPASRYEKLVQAEFLACGTAKLASGLISSVAVDILELQAGPK